MQKGWIGSTHQSRQLLIWIDGVTEDRRSVAIVRRPDRGVDVFVH
jgi:hypothetical protein